MSEFVRTLNLIKLRRSRTWLTGTQRVAAKELSEVLRVPCSVNLCGACGTGKTFLGWSLAEELSFEYYPGLDRLPEGLRSDLAGVVVDNCLPHRQYYRQALKMLSFRDIHRSVLISREPIRDYIRYVELALTTEDITKVRENLLALGVSRDIREPKSLWELVNPAEAMSERY